MRIKNFFWAMILLPFLGLAQDDTQEDLKVGLVLSGGGAKGLAHVGALKIIEEAGIRIDYIGGTSMGAIVGGLYASGYTANQLDSIFNVLDFDTLIQDDVPRSAKTFYEKEDGERYALTLPFDDFKVDFPSGISKGQNIYNLLSKLTTHVSEIEDFNQLPIPFFCVTTNVETGQAKIFNKGYLPRVISASGSIPSLFSPVKIGDSIYVDGGVVNNYPVDEVRAMGADLVIGIDVQDSLKTREELKSAISLLGQVNNYRTINAMKEKAGRTDIYIKPNIDDYNVVSFDEGNQIIRSGQIAAEGFRGRLEEIASRQTTGPKPKPEIRSADEVFIKEVVITGNENYTRAYVLGKLKIRTPSKIEYTDFSTGVNNLSATGNFDNINYRFIEDKDNAGEYTVHFDLVESGSRTLLRAGVHYDDLFKSAALVNITHKRLITNNDVVALDLILGDNIRYNFEYYIDKGYYWSVGLSSAYNFFAKNVATDFVQSDLNNVAVEIAGGPELNKIDFEYGDLTNRLFVQTVFQRIYLLELGGEHKWLKYLSETFGQDDQNKPRTVFDNTNYFSVYGLLKFDTEDDKYFPSSGWLFEGDFHWYLLAEGQNEDFESFSIGKAKVAYSHPFSDKWSGRISTEGGLRIGSSTTNSLDFFIGGYGYRPLNNFVPLMGFEAVSLRGDTYLKSAISLDFEFAKNHHFNGEFNIANVGDDLFATGQWIDEIDYSGFSIGYGWKTFLGPVELKYAYSPEVKEDVWYVNVGFSF
ncbi:patatin-like phospholipase family protein [Aureitalea marina]|uniref:Patatin n=1 Tax=Aureitalea marina TaxID=930804 RepID=A0A2S7KSP7_9FLAO|nr:patatin-like phospholipase family protein [Aureitalea marina]PQB05608.1 patatin [Aureitalea marina]